MDVAKFFVFFLTLYLTTMAGAAVCFAISATVRVFAVANLLSAFIFIVMMVYAMLVVLLPLNHAACFRLMVIVSIKTFWILLKLGHINRRVGFFGDTIKGKGKGKGLDTCYSATYMSQTRDK